MPTRTITLGTADISYLTLTPITGQAAPGPIAALKQGFNSFTGILAAGSRRSCLAVRTLLHMPHPLTVMRGLIFATFVTIPASTIGATTQSMGL